MTAIHHPAAIEADWQLLKNPDTPDDIAADACRYLMAACRDERRDTARDILAILDAGLKHETTETEKQS